VAPLSPIFLASLPNASCTSTYVIDIPYSCPFEDNTQKEGDRPQLWTLIRIGSTMPYDQTEVKGRYNDSSSCKGDSTKPTITVSLCHRSADSQKYPRICPYLAGAVQHCHQTIIENSSAIICHGHKFSSGVRSENYVIQYVVNVRLPTFWKLNDSAFVQPLSIAHAMAFRGKVRQQQQ
jgi:hypothetical protein